jgi:hypothetical protein
MEKNIKYNTIITALLALGFTSTTITGVVLYVKKHQEMKSIVNELVGLRPFKEQIHSESKKKNVSIKRFRKLIAAIKNANETIELKLNNMFAQLRRFPNQNKHQSLIHNLRRLARHIQSENKALRQMRVHNTDDVSRHLSELSSAESNIEKQVELTLYDTSEVADDDIYDDPAPNKLRVSYMRNKNAKISEQLSQMGADAQTSLHKGLSKHRSMTKNLAGI